MSEAKHTPGPWQTGRKGNECRIYADPDQHAIAKTYGIGLNGIGVCELTGPMNQADASLIAAAPDLLEALLAAHKRITEDRASYVWGAELPDGSMDTKDAAILHEAYDSKLAQIEAAIAKATAHKEGQ